MKFQLSVVLIKKLKLVLSSRNTPLFTCYLLIVKMTEIQTPQPKIGFVGPMSDIIKQKKEYHVKVHSDGTIKIGTEIPINSDGLEHTVSAVSTIPSKEDTNVLRVELIRTIDENHQLLFENACANGFLSLMKTMLLEGAHVYERLIQAIERFGKDPGLAILLQFVSEIENKEDLKTNHFDLLCAMFEFPPTQERDDRICSLLDNGADPLAFCGAAFSIVSMIEFTDVRSRDLLIEKSLAEVGEATYLGKDANLNFSCELTQQDADFNLEFNKDEEELEKIQTEK